MSNGAGDTGGAGETEKAEVNGHATDKNKRRQQMHISAEARAVPSHTPNGDFKIHYRIGKGGHGEVYLGQSSADPSDVVAVKVSPRVLSNWKALPTAPPPTPTSTPVLMSGWG